MERHGSVGEKERKTVGYRHRWFGANIGDMFTVIGYWNGDRFGRNQNTLTIVSKQSYDQIVKDYENRIWWAHTLCIAGLFLSGGVILKACIPQKHL